MEILVQRAVEGMEKNGFKVVTAHTAADAREYLLAQIQPGQSVGVGGSVSVQETGVLPELERRGHAVYSHWNAAAADADAVRRKAFDADVYLTSANAVTRTGKLVLVDGTGNRVGAVCYGPKTVYFIISQSKVVDGGINTSVARIKKTACPQNARRLGLDTPCAKTGLCKALECENSMCRLTVAVDRVPRGREMTVILVEEPLGY